jgi:hypothetical protein
VVLSLFHLEAAAGVVTARWEAAGEGMDFRLEARLGEASWQVPFAAAGGGLYVAVDATPLLAAGGIARYTLHGREAGEDWQLLRSESIALDALATAPRLLGAYPNPFNPQTTLRFTLGAPARVRLVVHDVTGRRVRVIADESFAAGVHERIWDGRDDGGNELASGIYLLRLNTAAGGQAQRLVLLR